MIKRHFKENVIILNKLPYLKKQRKKEILINKKPFVDSFKKFAFGFFVYLKITLM